MIDCKQRSSELSNLHSVKPCANAAAPCVPMLVSPMDNMIYRFSRRSRVESDLHSLTAPANATAPFASMLFNPIEYVMIYCEPRSSDLSN